MAFYSNVPKGLSSGKVFVYKPDTFGHQAWAGKRVESIESSTDGRVHAVQLSDSEFAADETSLVLVVAAFEHELTPTEIVNAEGWTEL